MAPEKGSLEEVGNDDVGILGLSRPKVPHYHGDGTRILFVSIAVLSLFVIPIWGNLLPFGEQTEIALAILLVILAGLTNPHSRFIIALDALAAAAGAFLLEAAAIYFYHSQSIMLFMSREIAAILFLFALYFSVKTVRAFAFGTLGHASEKGEFDAKKKIAPEKDSSQKK